MDIITGFEPVVVGSSPAGSTSGRGGQTALPESGRERIFDAEPREAKNHPPW